jgi:hypothetical protein
MKDLFSLCSMSDFLANQPLNSESTFTLTQSLAKEIASIIKKTTASELVLKFEHNNVIPKLATTDELLEIRKDPA